MNSLSVRGTFKGVTGYDQHTRNFVRELVSQNISVQLMDFSNWSTQKLYRHHRDPFFDNLSHPVKSNIVLHFTMPHQVQIEKGRLNVNFTMFEANRIPQGWVEHNLNHDLVIVPTQSSKEAWISSGYPEERIRLCPLGVDVEKFTANVEPFPLKDKSGKLVSKYKTRVLNISEVTPRKNLIGLLRTWIKSTTKNDDAILILKINCPWRRWLYKFYLDIKIMERSLGKSLKNSAPVLFIVNEKFSSVDMLRLYSSATHYWSMSHGEGWDLCMMEAAAAGLDLIAPQHSAYTEYLDSTVADMIPSKTVPANFRWAYGLQKYFKNTDWWEPDEETAEDYIKHIVTGSKRSNKVDIEKYSWRNATKQLIEILSELEPQKSINDSSQ